MSDEHAIIFLHLPKTGGTTLNEVFKRQYPPESVWEVAIHHEASMKQTAANYRRMPEVEKQRIRAIAGHQFFGLHRFIDKPCFYFTMLRDPVDRVISLYYFVQRSGYPVHEKLKGLSLEEFVARDVDVNTQTLLISGNGANLALAKENLKNYFPVVGVTEMFNESLFLLQKQFGWKDIHYEKRNVTKNRPKKKEIPEHILAGIREKNRLDFDLYQHARRRLSDALKALPAEEKQALERFKKEQQSHA